MKTGIALVFAMALLQGCSTAPNYEPYREAIKAQLRDPTSAEFKDEAIRTLWSDDGTRYKIYCAFVNSNNAFGGKAGFGPAQVIISVDNKSPDPYGTIRDVYKPGKVFIDENINPNVYLNCLRPDTKRPNGEVFKGWVTLGRPWSDSYKAEVDREMPVLSNEMAPEGR